MRMWMAEPRIMCRQHLLGEHRELHALAGSLNLKHKLDGYVDHNCLEFSKISQRHSELVGEMKRRGYRHLSPLKIPRGGCGQSDYVLSSRVDAKKSLSALLGRCNECRKRK